MARKHSLQSCASHKFMCAYTAFAHVQPLNLLQHSGAGEDVVSTPLGVVRVHSKSEETQAAQTYASLDGDCRGELKSDSLTLEGEDITSSYPIRPRILIPLLYLPKMISASRIYSYRYLFV